MDEPLYQAHLLLLDDAVKANLRTDADRQVVQQGINAAEGLYQQSKATETGVLEYRKSEIRSTKSETNPKTEIQKNRKQMRTSSLSSLFL